jgi:hypothetical protein
VFSEVGLAIGDVIGVACRGDKGEGIGERTELPALLERFELPAGGVAVEEEKGERTKPKKRFAFSLDASFPVLSENCGESRRFAAACGTGETGGDVGEHKMKVWGARSCLL